MEKNMREFVEDEQIAQLLKGLDDDITVPLDAAAAWRKAVRHEARKMKWLGRTRWAVEIAAAVALLIGATVAWRSLSVTPSTGAAVQNEGATRYVFYTSDSFAETQAAGAILVGNDGSEEAIEESLDRGSAARKALFSSVATDEVLFAAASPNEETAENEADARVRIADVKVNSANPSGDLETLTTIVNDTPSAYFEEKLLGETTVSGKIRVRNAQLDDMLKSISASMKCSVRLDEHAPAYAAEDLSAKIDTAYGEVDCLQAKIAQSDNADEISALKLQLQSAFDEIETYEQMVEASRYDLEYATVYYTIDDLSAQSVTAAGSQSAGIGGFLKDMLKVLTILIPTVVLSVLVTLHVQKRRKQKI